MGLLPKSGVGEITILRNPQPSPDDPRVIKATPFRISIKNIIDSCGERIPPFGQAPKKFTQALVVVSKSASSGQKLARDLEDFRKKYEEKFHEATDIGSLDTSVSST